MKLQIVTGIFGAYDALQRLPAEMTGRGTCFTDGGATGVVGGWTVTPLPPAAQQLASAARKARYAKTHATELVDADVVLYIDGSFRIVRDPTDWALAALGAGDFAAFRHPERDCVYDEADLCMQTVLDSPATIQAQVNGCRAAGLPRSAGLWAGGIFVARPTAAVRALCEAWWSEICLGSVREQLALGYVAWKHGWSITRSKATCTARASVSRSSRGLSTSVTRHERRRHACPVGRAGRSHRRRDRGAAAAHARRLREWPTTHV